MRHDLFTDSYRRYKRGTEKIAEWLANAGRLCGAKLDTSKKFGSAQKHRLPLTEYRDLAYTIAHCKEPEIEVRPELLDLLKEVISLREAASAFYRLNSPSNELFEQSNEGHLYIIRVLKDVLAQLQVLKQSEPSVRPTQPTGETTVFVDPNSNIFDALDLEDIAEPVVHLEIVKGSKGKAPKAKKTSGVKDTGELFEISSSAEELFFLLFCFFKDLHDVQTYLSEVWIGYRDGHVSLTSAAATTDLAFDVVKQKEEDLLRSEWTNGADGGHTTTVLDHLLVLQKTRTVSAVPLYWKFQKEGTLLNHGYLGELLYSYMCELNGNKIESHGKLDDTMQERLYQLGDWLYTPAYIVLDCAEAVSGGREPSAGAPRSVFSSSRNPHGAVAEESAKRFEKSFETLMAIVSELVQLRAARLDETVATDVWTKALCELVDPYKSETKKRMGGRNNRQVRNIIPLWLAFASTVYLDIKTCLGPTVQRGFHELRSDSRRSSKTIYEMSHWIKQHPGERAWTQQHSDVLDYVQNRLKTHVFKDPVATVSKMMGHPGGPTQSPHYLMRHHPLWAGIVKLWLQLSMWDITIEMTNIYTATDQATHLYALALTKNDENFEWKDMEYLINLHGPEYLFYGGRPTTASECVKKHSLSLGMSAQMSARDSRGKMKRSARGMASAARQHRPHVIPSDLLNWRYEAVRMRAGPAEGPQTDLPALELLLEFQKRKPDITLVKKNNNSAYLVPLLSLVQKAVAADVQHLTFDYFQMHKRCWALLEQLQNDLREDLTRMGRLTGENFLRTDQMTLRNIPGVIFNTVSALHESGRRVNLQIAQLAGMVLSAQKAVKLVASENGSAGLDAVTRILSTHVEEPQPEDVDSSTVDSDDEDSDSSVVDPKELAMLTSMLNLAPKRLVTDEEAKVALKKSKKTPFNKLSPDGQEWIKGLEAGGVDVSKGLMGILGGVNKTTAALTMEQQLRVLETTTLKEYNELLKTFQREAAEELAPSRR